ncbi:heme biosynthesis protein HemY [Kumtagia ephedrae]|uniref:Heme biosynthesis protein HemY n=1 Tax=Kumtagia ephedrae TaxID=2116701 RepID=A0A2P7S7M4_9HYPH|nr:heme biosynthesis protein HemY [Mesorhizobium ephedrae]PSJ58450.1 heme biosynthesis protein HemY [Mesorhizobium ephedrae]
MIRILFFLLVVFLLGLGFAWLADRPGDMVVTFQGYRYTVSLMAAAVGVVAIVAAVMIAWWLVKSIWNSPYTVARYFRVRRRDRGYQALSTGMIAAGAGDAALARKKNKEAAKLIRSDQEPLIRLLDAQAALLEGDHDGARDKFEAMLDDPEMRLLGLRGLYLEAERLGDRAAARHYAGRAADIAPQLGWAADSTIEEKIVSGDWDGALKIVDAQKATHQIERDAANRRRSVLLTAKATALFDVEFPHAKTAALEANRLRPDFVPAALVAARALFRGDDTRKGAKILEAAWKAEPHPDVADLYVHARHGDAVADRLTRARRLQSLRQNHPESSLAVARAALDAADYRLARKEAEAAIRMQPREGAWLLLADIEEAETGDVGKVRQLLARAVRAPRDPAWVADGFETDKWAPFSPVSGRLDAFEWRVPVERLGTLIEEEKAPVAPVEPPVLEAPSPVPAPGPVVEVQAEPAPPKSVPPPAPEPANDRKPAEPQPAKPAAVAGVVAPAFADTTFVDDESEPTQPPLPDDPGVDPDEAAKPRRRFSLF